MKAVVLADNITKCELTPEWGLSIYIEYQDHKILLDAGATGVMTQNAEAMGIDLSQVETAALSHAHHDHADGMEQFFEINNTAKWWLREGAAETCWGDDKSNPGNIVYIGIKEGLLDTYAERICYAAGDQEILPGVYLIPHKTPGLEKIGARMELFVRGEDGELYPDGFAHEQSLVFDTEKGLVIFNSCSHGGADNIIREVAETFPEKQIYAIIGGFHLFKATEEEVRSLADRIRATGIRQVVTGHCTGDVAFEILKEELGDRIRQSYTGLVMEF